MRRIAILCTVPVVVIAAAAAGVLVWSAQQNPTGLPPNSAGSGVPPSSSAPASDDPAPKGAPSENASGSTGEQEAVAEAVADCRREVAQSESVLQAASQGVDHWRQHVQAQTDLTLGRITEAETKAIWKRTRLPGPSDVAKYETARSGHKAVPDACKAVAGATTEQSEQLQLCRARLEKVRVALTGADLAMGDWADHLADMRKSASGHVHNAQEVWLDTWRAAPPNLEKYASAMDTLAKTKSCPS
ncbi:hypothetical protein [Microlunatus parietis]|uniref:Uncharacterized protein n=1 Tax=Microlunatus parietis TaxID=682979 RepID=A0A7Y9I7S1_9ACTN|nr:hypothetical protein [Microlunatus parietis]NYE71678.1 hypothetical protein [Microlunatus parietis]